MAKVNIKAKSGCTWDLVSLGKVMLRLDPDVLGLRCAMLIRRGLPDTPFWKKLRG
jgi:hypothetical protein